MTRPGGPAARERLRFDGRVAIVTGAGGRPSLGQAYAHLLAERGARVVVNDLGVGPDGRGVQRAHAEAVAQEIRDAGGEAIADTNSVAEPDTAKSVVQTALDAWGRVDVLINNAGVQNFAPFAEMSDEDVRRIVGVHTLGTIWMSRAVWPHMQEAGYGRIVNTVSRSLFGYARMVVYASAKAAGIGFTRCLAAEGASRGIQVNALGPGAFTNAEEYFAADPDTPAGLRTVERVAPVAIFLAHETCPFSGKYLETRSGIVTEVFLGQTKGYENASLTPEDVADNVDQILDRDGYEAIPEISKMSEEIDAQFRIYTPE
jgi:NAD(P)-dependent dehydrogenase (short-subunit alcohol dehydrogenase family)